MPWELTGNSGTNPANNFLGTKDNRALTIRTNGSERIRIAPGGNVGIGTTNPAAKLDVQGEVRSSGSSGGVLNAFNPNDQTANVFLGWGDNVARIRVGGDGVGSVNGLSIQSRADRTLMRLTHEGNIGIGTTNPNAGLHVSGTGGQGTILIERNGKSLSLNPNWQAEDEFAHITTVQGSNMGLQLDTNEVPKLTITVGGDVGIGTTNPEDTLEVVGGIRSSGSRGGFLRAVNPNNPGADVHLSWSNDVARIRVGGDGVGATNGLHIQSTSDRSLMRIHHNGTIDVPGDIRLLGADCAENFDVSEAEAAEPGTVMVIDQEGTLKPSEQPYDKRVAGVVSGAGGLKPGIVLDKQESNEGRLPVALVGKVGCNVDARHSPIEVGDLLTTSSTPGHAMKADDPLRSFGAVIGKALHSLKGGQGIIPVLIALQ